VVGPLIISIIALPFFLLVNGIAYLVTLVAIRKSHVRSAVESCNEVTALRVGIVIGYLLGRLL
jgi:hypothetical protein